MRIVKGLFIAIILVSVSMAAMPPKPGLYDMTTGRSVTTGDSLPVFPEHFGQAIGSAKTTADVVGVGKMAVALVDFPDRRADSDAHPATEYQSMIFSANEYPTGSLNDFFVENSYGLYSVEGSVYGWVTTDQQYSYFDDSNYGLSYGGQLVAEAAASLTDQFVDYSQYDNDGADGIPNSGDDDGYVDAFIVVHAGLGGEDSGNQHDIWSHASSINFATNDFKTGGGYIRIASYTIQPEERLNADNDTLITAISVISHEYGHALGLPDLYDGSRNTWGIGYWGLMGYGAWGAGGITPESPAHLCAWSKIQLGWIDPVNIDANNLSVEIPAVETNPVAYTIWRNGSPGDEYFILENRQQIGFDTPAPGHGLLIWHFNDNGGPYYNRLNLEQADGLNELDQGNGNRPDPHYYHHFMGDDADPFPGSTYNRLFGPETNPSSDADNGAPTDVIVGNISEIDGVIFADLIIDPDSYLNQPQNLTSEFGCESLILNWSPPDNGDPDGYNIYRRIDQGEWEIRNEEPIDDSTFIDYEIVYDMEFDIGVKAVYDGSESSPLITDPINIPDPASYDCLIVGDSSSEELNLWYKSILDSLGLNTRIVGDILPYCGETLAELPVLWLVSLPPQHEPSENSDSESAITDYLLGGGSIFIVDSYLTFTWDLMELLQFDYSLCVRPPFIHTYGGIGTFAEGLSYDFPDSMDVSYLCAMGETQESAVLLEDGYGCSSVAVVTNRLGFKAVINSQPLHEMLDGPNGTRLEFFNRMLLFFDIQTGLDENESPIIPTDHLLISAYPNPFNATVRLSISASGSYAGNIEIFDITGRLVRRFADVNTDIVWDGRGDNGQSVSSGIYFARVVAEEGLSSPVKLTLLK